MTEHESRPVACVRGGRDRPPTDRPPTDRAPMRVLHVASGDLWAGAEAQIHTLLTNLAGLGADDTPRPFDDATHDVKRCGPVTLRAVLLNDGELARRLAAGGIDVTVLDEQRLSSTAITAALRRELRSFQPNVIHTHRQKEQVLAAAANLTSIRAPMVRTQHGANEHPPGWRQPARKLARLLEVAAGRLPRTRVIAVSEPLAAELAGVYGQARVRVIENGVDAELIARRQRAAAFRDAEHPASPHTSSSASSPSPSTSTSISTSISTPAPSPSPSPGPGPGPGPGPSHIHVGFIGRLEPVKRIDLFLDVAVALCRDATHCWRFEVFGDGSLWQQAEASRNKLGLTQQVRFHGHDPNVVDSLNALDALVLCSDHEGLPMTVLEATAIGVPVVAHAVGGIPAALANRPDCILIDSQAPAAYADAVARVALPRARRRPLGVCSPVPLGRFEARSNARRTFELYQSLCGETVDAADTADGAR